MTDIPFEPCVLCQRPIVYGEPYYAVPMAKTHPECAALDGRTLEELRDLLTCCQSRDILMALGGHVVERRHSVPADEVWYLNRDTNEIYRQRLVPKGPVVLEQLAPLVPKKKEVVESAKADQRSGETGGVVAEGRQDPPRKPGRRSKKNKADGVVGDPPSADRV